MDEHLLEQSLKFANDQMMHHPVTKVCSKDFPLHRAIHNKCHTSPRRVRSLVDFVPQFDQVRFEIYFKHPSIMRRALIGPTAVICTEQITYVDTRIPTCTGCSRVLTHWRIEFKECQLHRDTGLTNHRWPTW